MESTAESQKPARRMPTWPGVPGSWRYVVQTLYPDLTIRTYCVPPLYFNRVPYGRVTIAGQSVLVNETAPKQPTVSTSSPLEPLPVDSSQRSPPPYVSQRMYDIFLSMAIPFSFQLISAVSRDRSLPSDQTVFILQTLLNAAQNVRLRDQSGQATPIQTTLQTSQQTISTSKPTKVQESDLVDDMAQQRVLYCLQELGQQQQEVMFILSQLLFKNYLNKPSPAAVQFPRPVELKEFRNGDFDILTVHRKYGILIGEVKAVGKKQVWSSQAESDADVAKKVEKAVKQLNKAEQMVLHMASDITQSPMVRKTLILPFVSEDQLQRVLDHDRNLKKDVCKCLGARDTLSAAQLCVCADQMFDPAPSGVKPDTSKLSAWWHRRMACKTDANMSDDAYLDLVSRLVGPATTVSVHCVVPPRVEVRTEGEAVSEVGQRLARLVLTPSQVHLLNWPQPLVCLSGPPGTGKTLMLILIGLCWLLQGHDVHIVSVWMESLASSLLMKHQLEITLNDPAAPPNVGTIHFHHYDLDSEQADEKEVMKELSSAVKDGELFVVMDEASFYFDRHTDRVTRLITTLSKTVPKLHLWASSLHHMMIPPCLKDEPLTVPLRCPPVVQREVAPEADVLNILGLRSYTVTDVTLPCDGPKIIYLHHQGQCHSGVWPVECIQCGELVARELRRLQVEVRDTGSPACLCPLPLQYRDVFVLTASAELCDDDETMTSQACGFVRGLRRESFPVKVLVASSSTDMIKLQSDILDLATAKYNTVTVTDVAAVRGLERKVIVLLRGRAPVRSYAGIFYNAIPEAFDRIRSMSRCLSQLIVVEVPAITAQAPVVANVPQTRAFAVEEPDLD